MNRSHTGLVSTLLFLSVYVFSISSYAFKDDNNHGRIPNDTKSRAMYFYVPNETETEHSSTVKLKPETKQLTKQITLKICCGQHQRFDVLSMKCVDVEEAGPDKIQYILDNMVVDAQMNPSQIDSPKFEYGFPKCSKENTVKFILTDQTVRSYYIDQMKGSFFAFFTNTTDIAISFSNTVYCLDKSMDENMYVAAVCPCLEKICIPKCCHKRYYFNTIENKCKKAATDEIRSYYSELMDISDNVTGVAPYYFLNRRPTCPDQDKIIQSVSDSSLRVQQNAVLMVRSKDDTTYYLDTDKYCIDMFSTGNQSQSSVNAFACSEDESTKFKIGARIDSRRSPERSSGHVHLSVLLEIFCSITATSIVTGKLFS